MQLCKYFTNGIISASPRLGFGNFGSGLDKIFTRFTGFVALSSLCTLPTLTFGHKVSKSQQIQSFNIINCPSNQNQLKILNPSIGIGIVRDYSKNSNVGEQAMASNSNDLVRLDFEVYGRVQGVFFRKYTQDKGQELGLRGFCRNTSAGTVTGSVEGPRAQIEKMKAWLKTTGSPMSRIDKVDFKNEKAVDDYIFKGQFGIERTI